jgi:predicted transcriptional regulator
MSEGRNLVRVTAWLSKADVAVLKQLAESSKVSLAWMIRAALADWVKKNGAQGVSVQKH